MRPAKASSASRRSRTVLRALLGLPLGVLAFLLFAVLFQPSWLLNDRTLSWLHEILARPHGLDWGAGHVSIGSLSPSKKRIVLELRRACLDLAEADSPQAHVCFESLLADVNFDIYKLFKHAFQPAFMLERINLLGLYGGRAVIRLPHRPQTVSDSTAGNEEFRPPSFRSPSFLADIRTGKISLQLLEWKVYLPVPPRRRSQGRPRHHGTLQGSLSLISLPEGKRPGQTLWRFQAREQTRPITVTAEFSHPTDTPLGRLFDAGTALLHARGRILGSGMTAVRLSLRGAREQPLGYSLRFDWRKAGRKRAQVRSTGTIDATEVRGTLHGSMFRAVPHLQELAARDCGFSVAFSRAAHRKRREQLTLECALEAEPDLGLAGTPERKPLESAEMRSLRIALKTQGRRPIQGKLIARLELRAAPVLAFSRAFSPVFSRFFKGRLVFRIQPIQTYLARIHGELDARVSGPLEDFPSSCLKACEAAGQLRLSAKIPEFRKAVALLNNTSWAVPAPFRVLEGTVALETKKEGDLRSLDFPIQLKTRLLSISQRFFTESSGSLGFFPGSESAAQLALKTRLSDVQLVLPRLQFSELPQVLPDRRIVPHPAGVPEAGTAAMGFAAGTAAGIRARPEPLTYRLEFETPPGHPIRLISNLAKSAVPLEMRLALTPRELTGELRAQSFALELFRRDATLEKFEVGFVPAGDTTEARQLVDGVIRVRYADYTVRVQLNGTVAKPKVTLTSIPPLPQDKLVSVLLFGQPLESLDPQQTSSLASVSSAMANGAINFISLYLLASTPIQSVGYDPRTGIFTARLRLGEGTSLNIGAEPGELQSIGIQKRLGPFWTIVTEFNDPTLPGRRSLQAFLQWSNRY